ncbi:hypothetical protein ACWEJ6_47740 [Nonomuraea sp. NPDC004702]
MDCAIFARVRGDYDDAFAGVRTVIRFGLPVLQFAVVPRSMPHGLPDLLQIADVFDVGKLKLILPLREGNALGPDEREFITDEEVFPSPGGASSRGARPDPVTNIALQLE